MEHLIRTIESHESDLLSMIGYLKRLRVALTQLLEPEHVTPAVFRHAQERLHELLQQVPFCAVHLDLRPIVTATELLLQEIAQAQIIAYQRYLATPCHENRDDATSAGIEYAKGAAS